MSRYHRTPFKLFRSGTSKGPFFDVRNVPSSQRSRDNFLIKVMGAGHPLQLDGIGGGYPNTSKVCLVGPSTNKENMLTNNAVDWTFIQVGTSERKIDSTHGDCGNMLAAVGSFAIENDFIGSDFLGSLINIDQQKNTQSVIVPIAVRSMVTGKYFEVSVPIIINSSQSNSSKLDVLVDYEKPNVIWSYKPYGSITGKLLPSGKVVDVCDIDNDGIKSISISCVDVSRPMIFVMESDVRPPHEIGSVFDAYTNECYDRVEQIRKKGGYILGLGDVTGKVSPKISLLSKSDDDRVAIVSRYFVAPFRQELHPTIAMTAGQCLAAACLIPGTLPNQLVNRSAISWTSNGNIDEASVPIKHAEGIVSIKIRGINLKSYGLQSTLEWDTGYTRTVRLLAEGFVTTSISSGSPTRGNL